MPSSKRLAPESVAPQTSESLVLAPFSLNQSAEGAKPTLQPSPTANVPAAARPADRSTSPASVEDATLIVVTDVPEVAAVEVGVEAVPSDELVVRAPLDHAPVLEHQDEIGVDDVAVLHREGRLPPG